MTYKGHVQGGAIILDAASDLADGTEVEVIPIESAKPTSWAEVLCDVIGTAGGLPSDSSLNHDHYLYGTAKRGESD